ncbi:MAG: DUF5666 domain-containing protein [Terracidiphilus sp.]|jgi:hypothetical protein
MPSYLLKISNKGVLAICASLLTLGLVVAGCTSAGNNSSNLITNTTTSVSPTTVTDAANDQVLATSLTINSIILKDSAGKVTSNLLATPITIEAAHLDAVQEPFFSPAIPEDTYVSVALTYSNAQVAYVNTATTPPSIVLDSTPTLENTSQTITFTAPITINDTTTSLLIDYLVAQSVAISGCTTSGCTVDVTPDFNVAAVPIPNAPTNGTNGLQTHKGVVTAISATTNSFTLTNPAGIALTIYVNANTVYQGIANFAALEVNALVEVDTQTQNGSGTLPKGSLLALRVEADDVGTTPKKMLLGPVASVTGTPATSFDMVLRQQVGNTSTTAPTVETVDVTVNGSTNFLLPPRYVIFATVLPFTPSFTASTIFAGQHVGVITTNYSSSGTPPTGTATASTVLLQPQTISGTITNITTAGSYTVYTVTLPTNHWLYKLTGLPTVLVYTNNLVVPLTAAPTTAGTTTVYRFNGYLFNTSNQLRLLACVQAGPPGTPII